MKWMHFRDGAAASRRAGSTRSRKAKPSFRCPSHSTSKKTGVDHQNCYARCASSQRNLPSEAEFRERLLPHLPEVMPTSLLGRIYHKLRPVNTKRYLPDEKREPHQNIWIKAKGSPAGRHSIAPMRTAYASDYLLMDTVTHGRVLFDPKIMFREFSQSHGLVSSRL